MGKKPPKLRVIDPSATALEPGATATEPPRALGDHGRALWDRITNEYDLSDVGGQEMLAQACAALDRAEALHDQVEADGAMIRGRGGIREHPGIKLELAQRAFVVRTLGRLGLDVEPVRAGAGRPPHGVGWQPP
jgi:hypothetical protein